MIVSLFSKLNLLYRIMPALMLGILSLFGACYINHNLVLPKIEIRREDYTINFNQYSQYVNAGLSRLITAILWTETLMDSDVDRQFPRNKNSWMYFRFYTIASLDPHFLENYQFGGKYLSIVKDDLLGAEKIFTMGLKYYPDDYQINYDLAFLYFSELKELDKAIPILVKISSHSRAPEFLGALAATLMKKQNVDNEKIIKFLEEAKLEAKSDFIRKLYDEKIMKLRKAK